MFIGGDMGQRENKLKDDFLLLWQPKHPKARAWRINSGSGWVGKTRFAQDSHGKSILIENPRPLDAAPKGWPDLIACVPVTITADMVGKTIGQFTGYELKTGHVVLSEDQKKMRETFLAAGGEWVTVREGELAL